MPLTVIAVDSHSHTCQKCAKTWECTNNGVHTAICPSCGSTDTTGH